MKREATISDCGLYRFDLRRTIEPACSCKRCRLNSRRHRGYVLWVLANPSTADAVADDATERRGWAFTEFWGYGEMVFTNVSPFRSTDPKLVQPLPLEIEAMNAGYLVHHAERAAIIVCGWGTHADKQLAARAAGILKRAAPEGKIYTLGLTKDGSPKHPLYLGADIAPQLWDSI